METVRLRLSTSKDLKEVRLRPRATGCSAHVIGAQVWPGPCKRAAPEREGMERTDGEPKTPLASPSDTL